MSTFTFRMYQPDHADKERVLSLLLSMNEPAGAVPGFGLGEYIFTGWRDLDPPIQQTLALIFVDSDDLVALCWLEKPNEFALSVSPQIEGTPIEADLVREAIPFAKSRLRMLEPDSSEPIGTTIGIDNARDAQILADIGMITDGDVRHHTYRWLAGQPIGRTPLPEGFNLAPVDSEARIAESVDLIHAVWPDLTLDVNRYHLLRSAPYYREDLDLRVLSPDGRQVAFVLGWFDPAGKSCQFEPVGCHPDFRGQGIARALVQDATHRAIELGCDRAYINCYAKNPAANALYVSAGYELVGRWQWWCLPVEETK